MAHDVTMPKVAMAMNEGTISEWLKAEGDKIEKGDILLSIETEKTAYEVEATDAGLLHIVAAQGDVVPVHTVIAKLAADEAELASLGGGEVGATDAPEPTEAPAPRQTEQALTKAPAMRGNGRVLASPLAKRIAGQENVDLSMVTGTGPGGRIKKRDILAYLETAAPSRGPEYAPSLPGQLREKTRIPVSGMRRAIKEGMMAAHTQQAMCPGAIEIEMENLLAVRRNFVERADRHGTRVSPQAFFIKALGLTARDVPIANAKMIDDEIIVYEDINVGIAIAVDGGHELLSGLMVPVIRNADRKGGSDFAACLACAKRYLYLS